jgi:hypothetical protein
MRIVILFMGLTLGLWAQTPAITFGALGGGAGGALIGATGLDFSGLPASERAAHRWRAGITYGAIGGVLGAAAGARWGSGPEPTEPHRFWLDKWNTPLFAGIVTVQALDFSSTRYFRNRGKDEWLLTNQLVDNRSAFVTTEISAAAAAISLSYLFHRSGHHRWERWAAAAYIGFGVLSAVANYRYPTTGHGLF